ncbi:MAG: DUF1919 domain-containing protein [Lachnospiraceae bacterium]|nr:DUF1919 domain-containing protein [Lachnospiraceae bacterium]
MNILIWTYDSTGLFENKKAVERIKKNNSVVTAFGKKEFDPEGSDYVVVFPEKLAPLLSKARARIYGSPKEYGYDMESLCRANRGFLKVGRDKLISGETLQKTGLDINDYIKLRRSNIDFVTETCIGGALEHVLGLRFNNPFINMRIGFFSSDYRKLLKDYGRYSSMLPKTETDGFMNGFSKRGGFEGRTAYPVLWFDDIVLHGFHYKSAEDMLDKYSQRMKRWDPLKSIVVKIIYDEEDLDFFMDLKIERKLGFYYGTTDTENVIRIPFDETEKKKWAYSYASYLYQLAISGEIFKVSELGKWLLKKIDEWSE